MKSQIRVSLSVLGIPLLIFLFLWKLVDTTAFQNYPSQLSTGILLDFMITIPLIYFLLIRKNKSISNSSVLSVFVICLLLAGLVIPYEHQSLLQSIQYVIIPLIELSIIFLLTVKTKKIISKFRSENGGHVDFYDAITSACTSVLPGAIGKVLATEVAAVYYLFSSSKTGDQSASEYTYFRSNGIKTIVGTLLFLLLAETVVVHLLIHKWSATWAWILTALSLYTCLQFVALLKSMNHRLIQIDPENRILHLRYGFFSQTSVPLIEIHSVTKHRGSLPSDGSVVDFSPLGLLDTHNVLIELHNTQWLHRLYGIRKSFHALAIYVDEVDTFIEEIEMLKTKDVI